MYYVESWNHCKGLDYSPGTTQGQKLKIIYICSYSRKNLSFDTPRNLKIFLKYKVLLDYQVCWSNLFTVYNSLTMKPWIHLFKTWVWSLGLRKNLVFNKKKNPAHRRHWISWAMRIVGPIRFWRSCIVFFVGRWHDFLTFFRRILLLLVWVRSSESGTFRQLAFMTNRPILNNIRE